MSDKTDLNKKKENFSSSLGFLFSAIAAAVGLSNIWRFSSEAAQNGGGIYVLCYIACVVLVGLPVILAELALGRTKQKGVYESYQDQGNWKWLGMLCAVLCLAVFCFYNIVAGWVVGYFWKLISGGLHKIDVTGGQAAFSKVFDELRANWSGNLVWTLIMVLGAVFINQAGVSGGIEKCAKILMPIFMVMMVLLIVYALSLSDAWEGISFYLWPSWAKFSLKGLASALGQSLMSLGIGMGAMVTYGAYVDKKDNLSKSSFVIATGDTLVAILSGFFIFAFLGHAKTDFSSAKELGSTGLAFTTLPYNLLTTLSPILAGVILGAFFLLLIFAAITSSISLLEVPTKYLESYFKMDRKKAIWVLALGSYVISALCILSDFWTPSGSDSKNFHDLYQSVIINILTPFALFLFSVFVAFRWRTESLFKEAYPEGEKAPNKFFVTYTNVTLKYICPILSGFSFLYSIYILFFGG